MKFDAEYQEELGVNAVHVDNVASLPDGVRKGLDRLGDGVQVLSRKVEDGEFRIGLDHDRQLHLSLELLDVGRVLRLGTGVVIGSRVRHGEPDLFKDGLGLSSFTKIIVAEEDSTSEVWNSSVEALILGVVSNVHGDGRGITD